jgi:hypothetical protein
VFEWIRKVTAKLWLDKLLNYQLSPWKLIWKEPVITGVTRRLSLYQIWYQCQWFVIPGVQSCATLLPYCNSVVPTRDHKENISVSSSFAATYMIGLYLESYQELLLRVYYFGVKTPGCRTGRNVSLGNGWCRNVVTSVRSVFAERICISNLVLFSSFYLSLSSHPSK